MNKKTATSYFNHQKGQSLVEAALILPFLLVLIAGLVEVSNLMITKNRVETAARAAARFASQGGDQVEEVVLNTVTETLDLSSGVWDIWLIEGVINESGTDFDSWITDGIYGMGQPTTAYTDVINIIGDDCIRDPAPINVNDPDNNTCIRDQVLAQLQKEVTGVGTPGVSDLADLRFFSVYISHDIESILGLNAFPALSGILSSSGFSVMRTTSQTSQDATAGCLTAMPIGFDIGLKSLQAGSFPDATEFTTYSGYTPPVYGNFSDNVGNIPLNENPREGYIYQVDGASLRLVWLKWNSGIDGGNATLANSLDWPGDAFDYQSYGDTGSYFTPPGWVARGFIEVGDSTDRVMHVGDQISPNETATIAGIESKLQEHIDAERALRLITLPVGGGAPQYMPAPDNRAYHNIERFGIFRLHGYSLSGNWLLVEFLSWDESCGQQ